MALQNRIDPFGKIIRTMARGAWMGNRGILHDDYRRIVRPFAGKAWITCALSFKRRKREVMAPNHYTELFFLDEATAFAAGHRPCFECRREQATLFKSFWLKGNPNFHCDGKTLIGHIDHILHKERIDAKKEKVIFEADGEQLVNGAFVLFERDAYLYWNRLFHMWSPFGYDRAVILPGKKFNVLTPRSIVNTFKAGYVPQIESHVKTWIQ
jgi:hypothetical protein